MSRPGSSNQQKFIKQYVSSVIDFSSQYGSENPRSVSYSISNIVGEPRIFPAYGDYTQAAVFRTYGTWWDNSSESQLNQSRPKSSKTFFGRDYVDLLFEEAVYPWSIGIYETYNPGAVVRILALTENPCTKGQPIPLPLKTDCCNWEILWECQSLDENLPNPPRESRMFAPALLRSMHLTRIIRLEFCSTHLSYYTEIDAVELTGTSINYLSSSVDLPLALIENLSISNDDEITDLGDEFPNGYFDLLPRELICYIFSFLPLPTLCRCARVCRLFQELSYDATQFSVIDLSSSWHMINDEALSSIMAHCSSITESIEDDHKPPTLPQVQVLDLSWCGGGGIVTQSTLVNFVEKCGSSLLTHLVMSSSPAVSDDVLKGIVQYCPNLSFLNLQSCRSLTSEGLRNLHKLEKLIYLNLYRTMIDDAGIICTVHSNPGLQHLNLGSCPKVADYDRCGGLQSSTGCFRTLATECPELKQLYVTANRTISDMEIHTLADFCPYLERLDILGTRLVSVSSIQHLLRSCKSLQFLDVSFCFEFTEPVVRSLETQFPHVAIKRSYQDET